mgnify:CR=1 FL=1
MRMASPSIRPGTRTLPGARGRSCFRVQMSRVACSFDARGVVKRMICDGSTVFIATPRHRLNTSHHAINVDIVSRPLSPQTDPRIAISAASAAARVSAAARMAHALPRVRPLSQVLMQKSIDIAGLLNDAVAGTS